MYEHTYVWFSLKAAYKLSLSVGKIVLLLFSWNIPGWKFVTSLFLLKNLVVYFLAFLLHNWWPHRLIQLITQTDFECFDNDGLVWSFHSKKPLESVPFEGLVMTEIKTGVSGSEGMGWRTKLYLSRQNQIFLFFWYLSSRLLSICGYPHVDIISVTWSWDLCPITLKDLLFK